MKKVLIGLGAVLVLTIGGVVFLYSNLGGVIKEAVQKFGSEAAQATVRLNSVDLDPATGKAAINGFIVGNPAGFRTESAFELGSIAVQIDTASLNSDVVVINSIAIMNPKITYELSSGGSNVDVIKANVDSYAKQFRAPGGGGPPSSPEGGAETKIVIDKLTITGGRVNVSAGFLRGETLGSALPDLTITGIGRDSGGASPAEVIKSVIDGMTSNVGSVISGLNLDGLAKEAAGKARRAVEGTVSGSQDALKSAVEDAGGAASGVLEGAGDKIKGLFGN